MTPSIHQLRTLAVVGILACSACKKSGGHEADMPANGPTVTKVAPTPSTGALADKPNAPAENRKIIRTGSLRITVDTYDEARAKLDAMLQQAGGYVDSTQVNRGRNEVTGATIVVRMPADAFGTIVPKLRELGEITSETTNAEDITDTYIDIAARLASAQALEKRLLELATERNGTVESILAVEKELARVRGEIEGYEGHLRQWNDAIAMSTLTLSLSTKSPEIVASTSFGGRVTGTFHESVHALRQLGGWLIVALIALLPWLLILIPTTLVVRRLERGGALRKLRTKLWG